MPKISQKIDKLTNSILNRISGESFATDVLELKREELKNLKRGWRFEWKKEFQNGKVYKLVNRYAPEVIQGLISLVNGNDHIYINLIETAPHNFGSNKIYEGVAGNLVAFACKLSLDCGFDGYVSFEAKTKLIGHYEKTLKAKLLTHNRMYIDKNAAENLIDKYFNS
ncbi:MAG: hypothetical protein Q8R96_11570 [Bacteroidota bacterium]|nr:hypothetical protein [Bacteroidota bacterium]